MNCRRCSGDATRTLRSVHGARNDKHSRTSAQRTGRALA
ncbi:hypothetical protein I549_4419 [Mycobacterium avium subsp. avium 2285 (R)]|nr:hypothetical protein L839_3817 [Mycobacterium avium MAV_120809_2495]ETZ45716.1 hypothetical protein L837_2221 [Mycobacterium avium MAV_061107_1842]ETZ74935.1 hypothetical protein L841_0532 [Mycobacterium sp. MAC_080597_8934]EUA37046.1 hypothetical protein I549_4419 [Mycobacterium avium subsp. avium 2285 (R)]